MTYQEKLELALQALVDELDAYDVPQTDEDGLFGPDTAVGYAREVLKEKLEVAQ